MYTLKTFSVFLRVNVNVAWVNFLGQSVSNVLFRKDSSLCAIYIVVDIKTFVSYVDKYLHLIMLYFCPGFLNLVYLWILLFMAGKGVTLAVVVTF